MMISFNRKRPLFTGDQNQPPTCRRKHSPHCSLSASIPDAQTMGCERMLFWADTLNAAKKVLEDLRFKRAPTNIHLDDLVTSKFLAFRRDITDEWGADDKQHSWAVMEKREEVIMYGPYYPNYSSGEHSEDIIIRQTQQLLESEGFPSDWKVFVFTMNSPCLARNSDPCMLNLVHKAWEWWRIYGVKTHIGFLRCWGFKGNKENLFKDVTYKHLECIEHSVDYEGCSKAGNTIPDFNVVDESIFTVAKDLLRSRSKIFPLITAEEKPDQKGYFKSINSILESKPEDEKKLLTEELSRLVDAADALLSGEHLSLEEHLKRGMVFLLGYTFSPELPENLRAEVALRFQQCWTETVEDRYAEFVREMLTEEFNRCTVQLFISDVLDFAHEYLKIGKLQFEVKKN